MTHVISNMGISEVSCFPRRHIWSWARHGPPHGAGGCCGQGDRL